MLAGLLTDFKDALMTGCAGTARPSQLQAGGMWIDTSLQNAPTYQWIYKVWTGSVDIEVFRINVNSNFGGALTSDSIFEVTQVSADAVGALVELIKQRTTVENGQVLSGDTVAEIRFVGRANNASDPTCGYIKWVATDDQLSGTFGGTFSFFSTPDASSVITEHMRAILGQMETLVPAKIAALRHVTQNVATASTIVQLSAAKAGVEFTGSTNTDVQGINAGHDSQEVVLHNRSTGIVTLKHQNGTATAVDRMKLPNGADFILSPEATVTLYYCLADSRWKIRSSVSSTITRATQRVLGLINTWTAPTGVTRINIYAKRRGLGLPANPRFIDRYGNGYSWGSNGNYDYGDSTNVDKSSPVAIAGGIKFKYMAERMHRETTPGYMGIDENGNAYSWGLNTKGKLGHSLDGDIVPTPVAVLGGIKFSKIFIGAASNSNWTMGIAQDGNMYGWGENNVGVGLNIGILGVGTITEAYSSPILVVGGHKWEWMSSDNDGVLALTSEGKAYGWGDQFNGSLGLDSPATGSGQETFSSPVAVLGGLTFKKLAFTSSDSSFPPAYGLATNGAIYAWGNNNTYGQQGVGDTAAHSSPVLVLGGLTFIDMVSSGTHVLALTADGSAYAWGRNHRGQLGVGDVTPRSSPVAVLGGIKFRKLFVAGGNRDSSYGIAEDGTLHAWGFNSSGELGVGDVTPRSTPTSVLGGITFSELYPVLACYGIGRDGILYGWGRNDGPGYIGCGDRTDRSTPTAIVGPAGFNAVKETFVTSIPVVPGQTYDVYISQVGPCKFGSTSIGRELEEITIEYERRGI